MKRRPLGSRKQKADPQTRLQGVYAQLGTMQLGDSADQAEAEAVARRRAAEFSPIEAVRKARQVNHGHARSVILDRQKHAGLGAAGQADPDASARWCMAQRVLYQVRERLRHEFLVAAHGNAWRDGRGQLVARVLCVQTVRVSDGLGNSAKVDVAK